MPIRFASEAWPRPGLAWPRPGLAQASLSFEAPRLQALETRDLLHQHNRKGKVVVIKTRRHKRLVFGSFFGPETDMIFGDGVGASLVRSPYCQLDVGLCDVDVFLHWNSAAEEGAWVVLKPDLQGGTGFNLLRSIFGPPCRGNVFQKGSESGPA